jgi:Flp pilus assembly secretin CpaC
MISLFVMITILGGCAAVKNYDGSLSIKNLPQASERIEKELKKSIIVGSPQISVKGSKSNIELIGVNVGDAVKIIYSEVLKIPFVMSQEVGRLENRIDISIKKKISHGDLIKTMKRALNMVGVQVMEREGVHFLSMPKEKESIDYDDRKNVHVRTLENIDSASVMVLLEKVLTATFPGFVYAVAPGSGLLVYTAKDEDQDKISKIIDGADIESDQVYCEVMIIEAVRDGVLSNGLVSYLSGTVAGVKAAFSLGAAPSLAGMSQISLISNPDTFSNILGILAETGIIRNMANPFLVMRSGKTASLLMGDEIPVLTGTTTTESGSQTQNISYRKTGINIDLLPMVIGNIIYMDVNISTSNGEINKLSNINSPSISTRSIKSSIKINHNESVLIGGIVKEKSSMINSGLPIDDKIYNDYINMNQRIKNKTEMLVYLKPIILNSEQNQRLLELKESEFSEMKR